MTLLVAILVGAGLGYAIERVPAKALIRSVAAALLGWLGGSAARVLLWAAQGASEWSAATITVDMSDLAIAVASIAAAAGVLHWVFEWLSGAVADAFVEHRAPILGALGALAAIGYVSGITLSSV